MIRLLFVDDQEIFRHGLVSLLSLENDLEVIGEAKDGREAIALTEQLQPDVILMDVKMPICDGVAATREIVRQFPWMRILVLTTFDDDEYIWQSLKAGALGYLLKRSPCEQIATAIRSVYQGYSQLGPTIAPKVFAQIDANICQKSHFQDLLSKREIEILQSIGQGKNNQEIAGELYLSIGTVKNYITQILSKLNLRDRIAAALWSRQNLL